MWKQEAGIWNLEFGHEIQILNSKFLIAKDRSCPSAAGVCASWPRRNHMAPLVGRRRMMQWGLSSISAPVLGRMLGVAVAAQDFGPGSGRLGVIGGRDESVLFPGKGLPGGGQLEIRLVQSMYPSDADELEVGQRARR